MPDLKAKLSAIEEKLSASLAEVRAELSHQGNKGARVEQELRQFLKDHLPSSYGCGHGEIIDMNGASSKQMDVVITNEYHPFKYGEHPGLFLIEGVAAAGEVKSSLDTKELHDSIEKSLSLRKLSADPGQGSIRHCVPGDHRFFESPPFFLFAFESKISLGKVDEILMQVTQEKGRTIDALFVPKTGHSIDYGDGKGALYFELEDGEHLKGWFTEDSGNAQVLVQFLGWLHACMPIMQRFTPVLPPYLFKGITRTSFPPTGSHSA
jgi:hypothetical protein